MDNVLIVVILGVTTTKKGKGYIIYRPVTYQCYQTFGKARHIDPKSGDKGVQVPAFGFTEQKLVQN